MSVPSADIYIIDLWLDEKQTESELRLLNAVFPRLRRRYIAAQSALRRLLAQYTGNDPQSLPIAKGTYGKPYLPQQPHIAFNLSHSEDLALLAVCAGQSPADRINLGIDLEYYRRSPIFIKISSRYVTESERASLPPFQSPAFTGEFLRLWTRKEAVTKCLGTGLHTSLRDFSSPLNQNPARVQWNNPALSARLTVQDIDISPLLPAAESAFLASLCSDQAALNCKIRNV